jgi:hypothetical protein
MLGMPTLIARRCVGRLLTILAFAILIPAGADATYLRLRIDGTPFSMVQFERFLAARHQSPASPEARKKLFQEFLAWNRTHKRRP